MNNLGIDFTYDFGQIIDDLPNTLTVGTREYCCIADEETKSIEAEDEGAYTVFDRLVYLTLSSVRAVSEVQDVVTLDEVKYYVADIGKHEESDSLTYTLRRRSGGTTLN